MKAAIKRKSISSLQIEDLLARRASLSSIKRRYDLLEESVKASEQEIIYLLQNGSDVPADFDLQVKEIERRYPHWKELYGTLAAQTPSAPSTQEILANTPPNVTKSLVIK